MRPLVNKEQELRMPPAKRSSSGRSTSSSSRSGGTRASSSSRSTGARATKAAARTGTKSTGTSARKGAAKTATQAKSGATKTRSSAKSGAAKTAGAAKSTAKSAATTAKTAGTAAASTARTARAGAKGTATAAAGGAKTTRTSAKAAATKTTRASKGAAPSVAEQLAQGAVKPRDVVMLTRGHIQEALDDAAARGRVTRKDANDLVSELVRRGRGGGNDLVKEIESLLSKAGAATKRARGSDPVDRIVRGADRARRAAGVGPTFPILGYDDLNAAQVQSRIKELKKPELRKVLTYERKNANRKSVVGALEKSLA
jgi:polyhydroxyalkanoate synthesis regulator phasin